MAALRKDPQLAHKTYQCIRLPDGRVGNYIKGSKRPIRDDIQDKEPHGTLDMERGIVVSCNAYFAQLGTYDVGADALLATANMLGVSVAAPDTAAELRKSLPQSSYGQGQVVASPFQMARVAATVANGGNMPQGRWITDETNTRTNAPQSVLAPDIAQNAGQIHARSGDLRHRAAGGGSGRAHGRQDRHRRTGRCSFPRLVHRLRALRRQPAQDRVLRAGGKWSVRRHGCRAGGGGDRQRSGEVGTDPVRLFSDIEKTIERGFRKWTERVFGPAQSDELLLVHRAILEEIESKVQTVARGRRIFPYGRLAVTLSSADADRRAIYQAAFAEGGRLESDIRDALESAGCEAPRGFAVEVKTAAEGERAFVIEYGTAGAAPKAAADRLPARLVLVAGKTEREAYQLVHKRDQYRPHGGAHRYRAAHRAAQRGGV